MQIKGAHTMFTKCGYYTFDADCSYYCGKKEGHKGNHGMWDIRF